MGDVQAESVPFDPWAQNPDPFAPPPPPALMETPAFVKPGGWTPELAEAARQRFLDEVAPAETWVLFTVGSFLALTPAILFSVITVLVVLVLGLSLWIVGTAFALGLILGVAWSVRRYRAFGGTDAEFHAFGQRARVVMGYPLMATNSSAQPGYGLATALVLVCFDDPQTDLTVAASLLGSNELDHFGSTVPDVPPPNANLIERMMADQRCVSHQRVPIPTPGGPTLHALHQTVIERFMPAGILRDDWPLIPTLAEPGDRGRCIPLPWWLAAGGSPSDQDVLAWQMLRHEMLLKDPVPDPPAWLADFTGVDPTKRPTSSDNA